MLIKQQINFGYKSPLTDLVRIDAYTGEPLSKRRKSLEHIKAHSQEGENTLSNFLIVSKAINEKRGNTRFDTWLKMRPETAGHIQEYLNKLRGLQVNGVDYVEAVKKTLNAEARGVATFQGNK